MKIESLPEKDKEEIIKKFQLSKEGISFDYPSMEFSGPIQFIRYVLGKSNSEERLREVLFKKIRNFRTYTEYMVEKKEQGIDLSGFLTEKGKEIVKEFDRIATEIRGLDAADSKSIDMPRLKILLEEGEKLWKGLEYFIP